MRLKLTLAYDGTGFRGWAAQPGLRTVEAALQEALDRIFPAWSGLVVAGRTDRGVHALANVVSVDAEGGPRLERVAEALNTALPDDVAVVSAEEAAPDFNARFSARRARIATASGGAACVRRSRRAGVGGIRGRSTSRACRVRPRC